MFLLEVNNLLRRHVLAISALMPDVDYGGREEEGMLIYCCAHERCTISMTHVFSSILMTYLRGTYTIHIMFTVHI